MPVDAILFDKDGTLFDFGATWNVWARRVIEDLAEGDGALAQALADSVRYDLAADSFLADSPVIAGTNRQAAECLASALPHRSVDEIERHLTISAAEAPLAPAVPLADFLDALAARGLVLGVMTNDTEYSARAQLGGAGVLDRFAFVAGFDSGYGAKPAPDPLLAFCDAVGVAPGRAAMVGDSTHDLIAGRAAGMATLGVLTGMAAAEELAPHADAVLPDIGHIPGWLAARPSRRI
ncbi:MAG: HAD family hydrolase [Pseudodonghicola sp.]